MGGKLLGSAVIGACVTIAVATGTGLAQTERAGRWAVEGGIGFTASPTTFEMGVAGLYGINSHFSIGPVAQFGVSDNHTIIAPTVNVRYSFALPGAKSEVARRFEPFLEGGVGFAWIDKPAVDEIGFLMDFGFGMEYAWNRNVSLVSRMLFNVLPAETAGENFFYTWQVLGAQYRF
jgi:hypothetical protein